MPGEGWAVFCACHDLQQLKEGVFSTDFWGKARGLPIPARRTSQLVKATPAEQLTLLESNSGVYLGCFFFLAALPLLPRTELLRDHKILMLTMDRGDIHQHKQRFTETMLDFENLWSCKCLNWKRSGEMWKNCYLTSSENAADPQVRSLNSQEEDGRKERREIKTMLICLILYFET